ncbi:MAG: hypothetical protein ACFFBP_08010 [Promethearchaeota archaeon]
MTSFTIYTIVLLIFSFFIPIEDMKVITIISSIIIAIPVILIFFYFDIIPFISTVFIFINQFITAFFALKFCIDSSIKTDDYLNKKKASKITRPLEFILFFLLTIIISILSVRFLLRFIDQITKVDIDKFIILFWTIFYWSSIILFWISIFLISITIIKLIFTKKFAAYISMFYFLTFLYIVYIVFDVWFGWFYRDYQVYDVLSFIIDFLLFLYIIGSIYERIDYIQEKLKITNIDSIGLFVIIMKLIVQINKITQEIQLRLTLEQLARQIFIQAFSLICFFIIFTIIIGIYYIFKYKTGKE